MELDTEYYTELSTRTLRTVPPSFKPETINAPCSAQFACITSLRPFDGLYGTILDDLDMFVITSNANMVMPCPPLGNHEWPQAFVPKYAHYACLRWHTPEVNDPLRPLYLGVTEYDWQELDNFVIVMSLGRMRRSTFWKLQAGCKAVIEAVTGVECSTVVTANMHSHIIMLERLLACLSDLPMSYQRMRLCHAETQHVARELHALVQYMTLYKPLMEAPESDAPPMPVDNGLVGAFSNDATTVQSFFKASIPVWRVISIKELPGVRVDKVCKFSNSPHPEEPSRLRLPTIFTGSSRDPTKYKKIHEFVTHSMCWVDLFALSSPIVKYRADIPLLEFSLNAMPKETPMIIPKSLQGAAVETIAGGAVTFVIIALIVLLIICYWQQNSVGWWIENRSHGRQRQTQVAEQQPVPVHYIPTNYPQHIGGGDPFYTPPASPAAGQQPSLRSLAARPTTPENVIIPPVAGPSGTRHALTDSSTSTDSEDIELDITELDPGVYSPQTHWSTERGKYVPRADSPTNTTSRTVTPNRITTGPIWQAHQTKTILHGDADMEQPVPYSEPLIPNSWPGHLLLLEGLPI
ncbi:hypothetical protein EDD18DRAFT_1363659 [Armillaria luteobubalina]|uniref:Uncharacterized protein n=1 Tax=Armillaria luteobubalina TaxID=153913 RepID=A0AA39PA96_9AGAR|nr:hypothetical protein EDD18DRAFT_1363659 [Armillaria luteobubalina]